MVSEISSHASLEMNLHISKLDKPIDTSNEEDNAFVKAMKKVWETVKWVFEKIAQYFVDAWHALFDKKVDQAKPNEETPPEVAPTFKVLAKDATPHPEKEKIKTTVKDIILGQNVMFRDTKTKNWYYPLSIMDAVREKLVKKGFENKITYVKKSDGPSENSDLHFLSLDWSKFSKEEVKDLAIKLLKKGENIYFHCGGYGSTSPYRLEFAKEMKEKLITEGYDVAEQLHIDDGTSVIYGDSMKGWVDGATLTATKKDYL